ncbi:MAG: SMC-Scp complex subunit ScpB [Lewinellaceae bacterium]|nr:SMC-Scp complex subunit ScpB [Saprospiraceae bacterium]MCB9337867.1 SMC-Scp complex subunit ScpB [Lewinellaceae bacterium]
MEKLAQHIEGLVFATDSPISQEEIKACLEETFETTLEEADLEAAIGQIRERYNAPEFAIELVEIAGGLQFMTKGAYHPTIATWLKQTTKKRLSQAAIETLSIIAYKQPVSKSDLEAIRGVSCDYSLQKLLEKELVSIVGRSEGPGRPLLYGTSIKFMDYFGLKSLNDLPKPKDFKEPGSEIGERAPLEETVDGDQWAGKEDSRETLGHEN